MRSALILIALIVFGGGGALYYVLQVSGDPPVKFRMVAVDRGDLASTISATGTLEPEEVIDVGAQVAGLIQELGPDPQSINGRVDYNSVVEKGMLLAKIDPRVYQAQYDQAEATLKRSKADLEQMKAKCNQTEKEAKRAEVLRPQNAIADTDYDLSIANYEVAKANVDVGAATIKQYEAALQMAKTNLDYTTIVSPVKGRIISRRVNIGQTVVASLSAPSLFLIAKDLSHMQLWSSVNEADIGRIYVGMPVQFTVDAFSGETFDGKVVQVRLDAQTTQNVVTYTVVVATDNSSGRLLPYLTANLRFQVDQHADVLRVPNVALRWKPRAAQIAPEYRKETASAGRASRDTGEGQGNALAGSALGATTAEKPKKEKEHGERGRLWVKDGSFVRPIDVQIGISDNAITEVSGDDLQEGLEVVMGESRNAAADDSDTTNPFLPKLRPGSVRTR
jgi:HlyD family secretion protein